MVSHAFGQTSSHLNNVVSCTLDSIAAIKVPRSDTIEVQGRIIDSEGNPAEAVQVWAASVFAEPPRREMVLTDSEGQFSLPLTRLDQKSDRWMLTAYRGSSGTKIDFNLGWLKEKTPVQPKPAVARLKKLSTTLCTIVEAETQKPVENARLYLGDGRVLISNQKGQIRIGGLPRNNHRAVVVASGLQRKRIAFDNTSDVNRDLNIGLAAAGQITGKVTDADGAPIPFAWIDTPASGTAMALDGLLTVADSNGNFIWEGANYDQETYSFAAGKDGFESQRIRGPLVRRDKPTEVTFRLKDLGIREPKPNTSTLNNTDSKPVTKLPLRNVSGKVVDPDGNPIAGAIVRWGATLYEEVRREQKTSIQGNFKLSQVPDRDGFITVIAENMSPKFYEIRKGKTRKIEIGLSKGSTAGAKVVDTKGQPLEGVRVVPLIRSPDRSLMNPLWLSELATETDKDGKFQITGLPSDRPVRFDFMHDKMTELRNQTLELNSNEQTIQLDGRGAFRGRVVDMDGNPVRNFVVKLDFPRNPEPTDLESGGFDIVMQRIGNSFSHPDGKFLMGSEIVPLAVYRINVTAEGYGECFIDRVTTTTSDQVDIAKEYIFQLPAPNILTLKVTNQDGKPVPQANVRIVNDDMHLDTGQFSWGFDDRGFKVHRTSSDGVLELLNLVQSEGTIVVQAKGFARHRFGWRDGQQEFTVSLQPESIVSGTVMDKSRKPLEGLWVVLTSEDNQYFSMPLEREDNGTFSFNELPAGNYTLELKDQRDALFSQEVTLKPGDSINLPLIVDSKTRKVKVRESAQ